MANSKFTTEKEVRAFKLGKYVYFRTDAVVSGLHVCVTTTGHKTWQLRYTSPESGKVVPHYCVGTFLTASHKRDDEPVMSLADARAEAVRLKTFIKQGVDPQKEKERAEAARLTDEQGGFGSIITLYVDSLKDRKAASAGLVEKALNDVMDDDIRKRPADPDKPSGITDRDVLRLINIARKNAQRNGNTGDRKSDLIYQYIHAAYEFARKAKYQAKWTDRAAPFREIRINPCADIQRSQSSGKPGENRLEAQDVVYFWNHAGVDALSLDLALYVKLSLALCGQRVLELLHAEWSEFDEETMLWSIPMSRRKIRHKAKHSEPHIVPLTEFSLDMLRQLRELSGRKYLFPDRTGKKPRTPDALNQGIYRFCHPQGSSKREPFKHFTGRDLRRTWKTLAGQAGLSKEIRDRLQGHSFGDVASVHYDRHDYLKEKRKAAEQWCRWLQRLATGEVAKVVTLNGGAA